MNVNFYDDQNFNGLEVGYTLEPTSGGSVPVYIPFLIPYTGGGIPITTGVPKPSTSNVLNSEGRSGVSGYSVSNYVTLRVPKAVLHEFPTAYCDSAKHECTGHKIVEIAWLMPKGTALIIGFPGGEVNEPRIIGLY